MKPLFSALISIFGAPYIIITAMETDDILLPTILLFLLIELRAFLSFFKADAPRFSDVSPTVEIWVLFHGKPSQKEWPEHVGI